MSYNRHITLGTIYSADNMTLENKAGFHLINPLIFINRIMYFEEYYLDL